MSKKENMISIIDEIIVLLNGTIISSENEKKFIGKYRCQFETFKSRIVNNEIDIKGIKDHTGLFKWLGEYDNIINNNYHLYEKVSEMEDIFTKP